MGRRFHGVRSVVLCLEDALAAVDVPEGLARLAELLPRLASLDRDHGSAPSFSFAPATLTWPGRSRVLPASRRWTASSVRRSARPGWTVGGGRGRDGAAADADPGDPGDPRPCGRARLARRALWPRPASASWRCGSGQRPPILPGAPPQARPDGLRRPAARSPGQPREPDGAGGFPPNRPVHEILDDVETLGREVTEDVAWGFVGKTAIHPAQVSLIHAAFAVDERDLHAARLILAPVRPPSSGMMAPCASRPPIGHGRRPSSRGPATMAAARPIRRTRFRAAPPDRTSRVDPARLPQIASRSTSAPNTLVDPGCLRGWAVVDAGPTSLRNGTTHQRFRDA